MRSLDLLSLEQIRMLSDKALVTMFAELTSNEMSRNYTYTCFLVPDSCTQSYSSFGNEMRAKMQMKSHLLKHVGDLLQKQNSGDSCKLTFTMEIKIAVNTLSTRMHKILSSHLLDYS